MGKFDGKVFLELGTSVASVDIVKYAKSEGAYVIVTDYLPTERSEAKQYADETAMISTLDVEALCQFAKEKKIDGVFCGVSEMNLLSVRAVAERLGLPCYFNKEQWDILQNKAEFKSLCEKFDIPVPKRFALSDEPTPEELTAVKYPVIVKPVDQGAGIGIHICYNEQELLDGYKDAYEKSYSHRVILEQYVVGDEISAVYTFINGRCSLSMMGDKYLNREQEGLLPLPEAYVYPSKHLNTFCDNANQKLMKMFEHMGLINGTIFVQGVFDGNDVVIFEAGLRMGGNALYNFVENINGTSTAKMLTNYSLLGKMDGDACLEDPRIKGKRCCLLSLLNGGGTIGKISGVEEARRVPGVITLDVVYHEGETILRSGTLKQRHIRAFVVCDSAEELKKSIEKIQNLISVTDVDGNNMLLGKFDTSKLIY